MQPVDLSRSFVHLTPDGGIELLTGRRQHPDVEGRLVGEARMKAPPPHGGERHPDGDELLYVVSGAIRVALDYEEREAEVVAVQAGRAFVVPRGVWHRVLVDEPCHLLHFTPGRSEVRQRRPAVSRR